MARLDGFRERRRGRFGPVLLSILATIAVTVAAPETKTWATVLAVMLGGTLWLAFLAAGASRKVVWAGLVAWIVASGVMGVAAASDASFRNSLGPILNMVLIAAAAVAILRNLVQRGTITMSSVGGVLAVYLLIGLFFTYVYDSIGAITHADPLQGEAPIDLSAELYFTFVTQTTVGYGDYTPATNLVRGVAITQALVGQLYLVSVVALVVGNLGREAPRRQGRPPDDDS